MNKFSIDFEIVTPMFMAGNNQKTAEFRLPSFKGALRFWYRAVSFPRLKSVETMKTEEDEVFGSTNNASKVILNLEAYRDGKKGVQFRNKGGLTYLGYGVVDFRGNTIRRYISPSTTGRITLLCRGLDKVQLNNLKNALTAFALFGNLGSRSRKGYGSINFRSITLDKGERVYVQPKTTDELINKIQNFCKINRLAQVNFQPPFSAFSAKSRIHILDSATDGIELLNSIGERMALYRSWGRNGRVVGKPAEKNFKADHDLVRNMEFGKKPTTHPERAIFGLPHNYFFGSTKFKANVEPDSKDLTRRASPLFIKIHKLAERSVVAVSLILNSQFLPQGTKIKVSSNKVTAKVPPRPKWDVLTDFIEGATKQGKPRFPKNKKVFP